MITSAQEFIRLRTSEHPEEYDRAANEEAPDAVWRELVTKHPDMRRWVAHNKTVPLAILELLHTDESVDVRCTVAGKRKLPEYLQRVLASDSDSSVRHFVASNAKTTQAVLEQLAVDKEAFVREAAIKHLISR